MGDYGVTHAEFRVGIIFWKERQLQTKMYIEQENIHDTCLRTKGKKDIYKPAHESNEWSPLRWKRVTSRDDT